MKKQYIIYAIIIILCVIAIGCGVYYEMFIKNDDIIYEPSNIIPNNAIDNSTQDPAQAKEDFNLLFTNNINFQNNRVSNIQKVDDTQEIVYTVIENEYEEEGKYTIHLNIPIINISSEVAKEFNTITQQVFLNKANDILENAQEYTIYNVDYTAFINNNILSIAIKSSLKEGNGAQRIIVQTYNYNLGTNEKVELNQILDSKQVNKNEVNKKIEEQVTQASKESEALSQALGQPIYKRDLSSAMYITDNVRNFLYGRNGSVYIIYAYGNTYETSEMDIIKLD